MFVFFDSHGKAWTTCSGEDPEAQAFGPTGIARELTEREVDAKNLWTDDELRTHAAVAKHQNRLHRDWEGGFDTLFAE